MTKHILKFMCYTRRYIIKSTFILKLFTFNEQFVYAFKMLICEYIKKNANYVVVSLLSFEINIIIYNNS